ncbi:cisplatin damage response ATP-dependent DNA ligase [Alphaproteobacteria bacterium LSUCC0719]
MKGFAALLETLVITSSRNAKIEALVRYFKTTPDPDRGYALAAITRDLALSNLKPGMLRQLVMERVDPELFLMSYDYVGDLAETIALIWPQPLATDGTTPSERDDDRDYGRDADRNDPGRVPGVAEFIGGIESMPKADIATHICDLLDNATASERWAMIKLATGGLRVGVSARLAKTALAAYGGQDLGEIEKIWHGLEIPYTGLFAWLDGRAAQPVIQPGRVFHPMMLSNPIDETRDFDRLVASDYQAEWKWDGIRVQLVFDHESRRVFSRTGDDVSGTFPDLATALQGHAVLDGELLVGHDFRPLAFNKLQQRLNRKSPTKAHLRDLPAFVRVYDMLFDGNDDLRDLPLASRRHRLEAWMRHHAGDRLDLSEILPFADWQDLARLRREGAEVHGYEGLMIKHRQSAYTAGRPRGPWFKWKREPRMIDTIMMYAQRGHGRRSSFYSDFTFGIWHGTEIVPVGKAYSGFTDDELRDLDKWVRANTTGRFGPVREVEKRLVVELAFDSAHDSPRHKSGIALRFPRINRIRWDKPTDEADTIETVRAFVE